MNLAPSRPASDRLSAGRKTAYWTVPRRWPGETAVCIGSGPSLTQAQVDSVRRLRVIAVNDVYRLAPWADVVHGCDGRWWQWHLEALKLDCIKTTLDSRVPYAWGVELLENSGKKGFDPNPWALRTGGNGGYQAVHLATHFGAKRILLLGMDCKPNGDKHHYFGNHPHNTPPPPYEVFLNLWGTLLEPLDEMGVQVLNCTPDSAIDVFEKVKLEDVL